MIAYCLSTPTQPFVITNCICSIDVNLFPKQRGIEERKPGRNAIVGHFYVGISLDINRDDCVSEIHNLFMFCQDNV